MIRLALALALTVLALPARALEIQDVTSPGGIRAWLVEDHSIPFTALEIRFEGGTALDAPGKRGAVNLMAALIEEGTGDLDAQAFANARDGLGANAVSRRSGQCRDLGAVVDRKPRSGGRSAGAGAGRTAV